MPALRSLRTPSGLAGHHSGPRPHADGQVGTPAHRSMFTCQKSATCSAPQLRSIPAAVFDTLPARYSQRLWGGPGACSSAMQSCRLERALRVQVSRRIKMTRPSNAWSSKRRFDPRPTHTYFRPCSLAKDSACCTVCAVVASTKYRAWPPAHEGQIMCLPHAFARKLA